MLHGVIPALLTPFTEGGAKVDVSALQRLCDHLVAARVDGAFITGTTGEFVSLDPDERRLVIREAMRFLSGRLLTIVHVGSFNTTEAVALLRFAAEQGVEAVGSMPPYFYPMDDEAQYVYFSRICEAADGMPVFLYNIPGCVGNVISLPLIARLKRAFPHLRGIKDSAGDMERLKATIDLGLPEFEVVSGADHRTLTALGLGSHASVTSTANAFPELFQAIYRAFEAGRYDEAAQAQERLTAATKVLRQGRYLATYKQALRMRGVDAGTVRPPQRELEREELDALRAGLVELGLLS